MSGVGLFRAAISDAVNNVVSKLVRRSRHYNKNGRANENKDSATE